VSAFELNGHLFVSPFFAEWSCTRCGMSWAGAEPTSAMKVEPCPGDELEPESANELEAED